MAIAQRQTTYVVQYDERIDVRHMVRNKNRSWPTSICQERKKSPCQSVVSTLCQVGDIDWYCIFILWNFIK